MAKTSNRWAVLTILMIGVSLIVLNSTIVSVSLPVIITSLDLSLTDAQWVSSLYSVVFAALLLFTGTLGDKFGRVLIFRIGLIVFALASLLAAVAGSAALLILARGLQGVGGAMILPSTLAAINTVFRDQERAQAFGIWGATMASMAAIGPLLGGWLTQSLSWHWIFLINIPIVIALLIAGHFVFGPDHKGDIVGFDVPGTLLSALALGLTVFGLIEGTSLGWWNSPVPFAIAFGLIATVLFIVLERARQRAGKPVLLDVRLFRIGSFSNGNITALTVALGEFSALFVLPLYLISVLRLGTIHAGWVLATLALGSILSGAAARHLAATFGPAVTVIIGLVLEVAGIAGAGLLIGPATSAPLIALVLAIYGAGVGLASAQLASVVLADVPVESSGMGSATQSTSRQLGSALGVAIAGTVLAIDVVRRVTEGLTNLGMTGPQAEQLAHATADSAGAAIPALAEKMGPDVGSVLSTAFADATSSVLYVSAGVLLLGLISAVRLAKR
ncbi:DHA2 family efflux MFS transporter permease subunit [Corynebacterium ulcerans]|nr:DHA2 family efflux MFS transporter permease subunit [Corynebacterium ulcerans]AIU90704.1 Major Facilitator Superfamily [Corynebacterium ulcerans]MBH5302963.1 DHA2 family efflux MFS transporter permease subunit [Corynebacterium ulcerans]MBL4944452.1 DHA2 family efflux MFS transporter permease subunit [Corynebacterium ulcerans]QGZ24523.1 DHA2 family efflux MFS transporter permease subunit [Corynebacterium ulcerans]QOE23277.1 DHA2 family efflux MFS transporter permease subunit [Corynebacterium